MIYERLGLLQNRKTGNLIHFIFILLFFVFSFLAVVKSFLLQKMKNKTKSDYRLIILSTEFW